MIYSFPNKFYSSFLAPHGCGVIIQPFQIFISHNVPAVYDVFASPIKETAGFQGLQKCGWDEPWEA
jgi:hypothetical protein